MLEGLAGFVEGRISRDSPNRAADLTLRKLRALEALSRHSRVTLEMVEPLTIRPELWPTSALIDWHNLVLRTTQLPNRSESLERARQILRSRLTLQGTTASFSTETRDRLSWMMISPDENAMRLLLMALEGRIWQEDLGQLARGIVGRQQNGHWDLTTANAWGVVALSKFSRRFESESVSGATLLSLGPTSREIEWPD